MPYEIPDDHPLRPYATTGMGLKLRIHPLGAAIAFQQLGRLDGYLQQRQTVASWMCDALGRLPGIAAPAPGADIRPSWYGLALRYRSEQLGGLPIDRFYAALHAEGCRDVDRPGSTCPLNLHPLFQNHGKLLAHYGQRLAYRPGDFPVAEGLQRNTLKLPVWHRPDDLALIDRYIAAFAKVARAAEPLRHRPEPLQSATGRRTADAQPPDRART